MIKNKFIIEPCILKALEKAESRENNKTERKIKYKLPKNKLQQQIFFLVDLIDFLVFKLTTNGILSEHERKDIEEIFNKIDEAEVGKNIFTY